MFKNNFVDTNPRRINVTSRQYTKREKQSLLLHVFCKKKNLHINQYNQIYVPFWGTNSPQYYVHFQKNKAIWLVITQLKLGQHRHPSLFTLYYYQKVNGTSALLCAVK